MNDQQRSAMQMALEALEEAHTVIEHKQDWRKREEVITALREVLAQPQDEWVDLRDVEIGYIYDDVSRTIEQEPTLIRFAKAAIAKFKEKNTPPSVEAATGSPSWEAFDIAIAAAIAETKEKAAEVCDVMLMAHPIKDDVNEAYQFGVSRCAAAIRSMK